MSRPASAREVHLVARPKGRPAPADFSLVEVPVPAPGPGQLLVRNQVMSVDPYMRGRMNDVKSYVPPFRLDQAMDGDAVGVVVESRAEGFAAGDTVAHFLGWREYALLDADGARKIDPALAPISAHLGVLGTTGLTAYAGLTDVGAFRPGDIVFVSGAAGAVGSVAGQLAKLMGASRVIGSAGGPEKVRLVLERYGFDAAFDYKAGPAAEQLTAAAPKGIDLYFDNVGGEQLEAAIDSMRLRGRVVLCGAISGYNSAEPVPGPRNLGLAIGKRLRLQGMIVMDHRSLIPHFQQQVGAWLRSGELVVDETVVDGIENGTQAFLDLFDGANIGKMVVRLGD